ncbi:hypothetical protein QP318_27155, partial [Escherichia coli]|nr:hypothetical protein [Escherichia coli]
FFTVLLLMGTKISSDFDAVLTVVKVGVVLFIIVAGFFYFKVGNLTPFVPPQQSVEAVSGSGSSVLTSLEQPLLQKALG